MTIPTITINLDAKCAECGKGGACGNGLCMSCAARALSGRRMKTDTARAVQVRMFNTLADGRKAIEEARRWKQ